MRTSFCVNDVHSQSQNTLESSIEKIKPDVSYFNRLFDPSQWPPDYEYEVVDVTVHEYKKVMTRMVLSYTNLISQEMMN